MCGKMDGEATFTCERVRFALFGGVRVVRGGAEVELTQPKQRAILALLLSTPSEPVYMSEIIDALWSGEPAASVTNQVHRHVGSLRRVFQPGLPRRQTGRYLLPAGTGYRLAVGSDDCDVLRFRTLVREASQFAGAGNRSEARRTYLGALAVAGAPAGEDTMWTLPAFVGLEDERVQAIIAAADQCETSDEFAAVVPVLRAAAARHQLNETLHAQLMTALTRTGRAMEALKVYARIRGELGDTLGTSPGAALEAAQAHALRGDAQPSSRDPGGPGHVPKVPPAQLPSPPPAFAGRRDVLATLREHAESGARVFVISGMAGVGKTTLALLCADKLVACHPDGQLWVNLRGFDATSPPTSPLDALRDMLQALGVPSQALPESVGARSGLLRSLLSERRVLVVLDNARDYRQVEPLLPGAGRSRVIITSRNQMPALAVFHQARTVQLEPFDGCEAVEFLSQRLSPNRAGHTGDAMTRLGQACGGLPLALAIIAARASANPAFPLDLLLQEFTQERSPLASLNAGSAELDLVTVFSWSYRGLSEDAARTFALLSAHPGPEISAHAAASISGLGPRRAREVLTELRLASVLRESRPGRFVFHDLIRAYALTLLAERSDEASARLISHYVRSTREAILTFGRSAMAPVDDTIPGIVPETFASSRDAIRWYIAERHVLHHVCRLAFSLGDYRSALMLMLDWRPMSQGVDARHDMLPFAELAIQAAGHVNEPDLRAECFREVAATFARTGRPERAQRYFDQAAETFQQTGNRAGQANVRRNRAQTLVTDPEQRIELLRESVAIARELDDEPILAVTLHGLALALQCSGRFDEELAALAECASITANQPGLAYLEAYVLATRSTALAKSGRLQESVDEAQAALKLIRCEGEIINELILLISHGDALTALGRTHEAAETWRRFLTLATSPELVQTTNNAEDDIDGAEIIARVKAKLAALTASGDQ
jgi:DNA-binding SARP family transcriptional activator